MILFLNADITQHDCDAVFFTCPADWPDRLQQFIPEDLLQAQQSVPRWIAEMRSKLEQVDPIKAKTVAWERGKLYAWQGPQRKVIFPCLGDDPSYGSFRDCLMRLRDSWERLGVTSVAMPRIGTGYGLEWRVIRDILIHFFVEPNPSINEERKTLLVQVYETDVPGKPE